MKKLVLIKPVDPLFRRLIARTNGGMPPVALGILAALTPKDWQVKILDENFAPFKYEDADLVGFTAFTTTAPRAYDIAGLYREKGVPTVMGGVHATMMPEEALQYVDSIVVGEAEVVWPKVLADFEAGKMERKYEGGFPEMKNMPIPRYDLFSRRCIGAVQTTRGCPMNCKYCSVTAFNGNRYRHRPVEEVLDELERIPKRLIFFLDDNIVGHGKENRDRAIELFDGMIKRRLNKFWAGQASMNFADDETVLEYASKSGCRLVMMGVEAEDPDALKEIRKPTNIRVLKKSYQDVFRRIHNHGIAVHGFFMYGMDVDTPDSLRKRTKFITTCGVDSVQISIVCPFPGTQLHEEIREQGRLRYTNFPEDWARYHFEDVAQVPKLMTPDELKAVVLEAYHEVHRRRAIFSRFIRTLRATRKWYAAVAAMKFGVLLRHLQLGVIKKLHRA